jgi:hypothetical protein
MPGGISVPSTMTEPVLPTDLPPTGYAALEEVAVELAGCEFAALDV